jgi:hypothetical protein
MAIEVDRRIDRFKDCVGLLIEPAAPHPLVHGSIPEGPTTR